MATRIGRFIQSIADHLTGPSLQVDAPTVKVTPVRHDPSWDHASTVCARLRSMGVPMTEAIESLEASNVPLRVQWAAGLDSLTDDPAPITLRGYQDIRALWSTIMRDTEEVMDAFRAATDRGDPPEVIRAGVARLQELREADITCQGLLMTNPFDIMRTQFLTDAERVRIYHTWGHRDVPPGGWSMGATPETTKTLLLGGE